MQHAQPIPCPPFVPSCPHASACSLGPSPLAPRPFARAFTLTEVLVTVGIIVLVLALGVPVFNVLRGSRSKEAGVNQVSAVVGQARTIAINEGVHAGVLFFVDPRNRRTTLAVVTVADPSDDPDPYDKYKGWQGAGGTGWPASGSAQEYFAGDLTVNPPELADRTIRMTQDEAASGGINFTTAPLSTPRTGVPTHVEAANGGAGPGAGGSYGRPVVRTWRAMEKHGSAAANAPYGYGDGTNASSFNSNFWGSASGGISLYSGAEFVLLPEGVGAQVIVQALSPDPAIASEFVNVGLIVFDPRGNMTLREFEIHDDSSIGKLLGFPANTSAINVPAGVGIAIYDQVSYRDQGFGDADYLAVRGGNPGSAVMKGGIPYGDPVAAALNRTTDPTVESNKENWLRSNATPFFVNRFSGAVSQGN